MSHDPLLRQGDTFFCCAEKPFIYCDPMNNGVSALTPINCKEANAVIMEGKTVQYEGVVRRQQDLSVLLFHQPLAKPAGEVLRSTWIERLIEIIDGKEARRFGMEGEYSIEQQI